VRQLLLLTVMAASGIFARTALGPLQEAVRVTLSLSDTQMALLQGPALALPLLLAAIPLGLWVDRYSRIWLLRTATILNVLASAAAAGAGTFDALMTVRCLVGLAAPATAIAAYSLLADGFDSTQRGRATMVVMLGQVGGSSAAFAVGGELLALFGSGPDAWRPAMVSMAALLAPVIGVTFALREPARRAMPAVKPSLREMGSALWGHRNVMATLVIGTALVNLADGAALVWAAPVMSRGFGIMPDRVGAIMGAALLVGGILGPVIGGTLADLCERSSGPRRTLRVMSALALASVPVGSFAVMPTIAAASVPLVLFLLIGNASSVMVTALCIVVIPNELRGLCMALQFAAGTVFGLGLAPVIISLLSAVIGGPAAIGDALATVCVVSSLLGAAALALGARTVPQKTPRHLVCL
jgi:MFS family permease